MSFKKMPPQAYTKETLQEAFEWWSKQPDDFRSQVQDKDDLVGYYLKQQRTVPQRDQELMDSSLSETAKASFSSELKGLAKDLDAFEGYRKAKSLEDASSQVPMERPEKKKNFAVSKSVFEPSYQMQFPEMTKKLVAEEEAPIRVPMTSRAVSLPKNNSPQSLPAPSNKKVGDRFYKLDERSYKAVQDAKAALNLTSDEEALRALIAVGISKIKSIL